MSESRIPSRPDPVAVLAAVATPLLPVSAAFAPGPESA